MEHEDLSYRMRLGGFNPVADNIGELGQALARDPAALTRAFADLGLQQIEVALGAARQLLGVQPPPLELPRGDKRFEDRAWRDNPFLRATVESYLNVARWSNELIEAADIPDSQHRRTRFGLNLLLDAAAPSNAPWLNPAVMKEAPDTGGRSLLKGAMNMLEDMVRNEGRPRQVDTSGFELGRNLAATPSRVVLRNDLIELLAYEPQTDKAYEQPIICSPPWINKYYVMDLAPGRSFIEHAVQNGFTVFCMSYRNPDASMSEYGLDEYLVRGVLASLDRVQEVIGAPVVNLFGLCAGGTMTAITLAHLAARSQSSRIGWAGVTNTLLDFHDSGDGRPD